MRRFSEIITGLVSILILSIALLFSAKYQAKVWADTTYLFHPEIGEAVIDGHIGVDKWSEADAYLMKLDTASVRDGLKTAKDQAEIDAFWEKLSSNSQFEQCHWCKDKFGVSWQIVPEIWKH